LAKLIIIALMSFSSAAFAAGHSGGKARLKQQLSCESAVISSLGEGYIDLFARLKAVAEKYDILSLTTPDIVQRNMGISIPAFYAEMNSLAAKILERSRQVAELDQILSDIEDLVSSGLQATAPRRRSQLIPNKAEMEARGFEYWGLASDMPRGPHDFNLAKKPAVEKEPMQQQQHLQPLKPQPPIDSHFYDPDSMPWLGPPRLKP